ncbi:Anti-anti-sigma regulatory factor (antagonist of anti-sigma factor) [Nannocystis exedens]|uniref:Anti-anti-sigma regulatory factor (Antagonist of anti-sigma factor) n=1 Tax=Nannocystis exedens TaxID=54 RepID=A0A1I1WIX9_9BACT|nr:STAS domain-containing protein [Nannocystis exedens]PCC67707.1 anti-anti sigma factor protein [Nannocystis exedens]SFD94338.1 Anti-anti-sigma regulatory factor (antagonist of anti-sigma factor) [Nannocystis exedens]
MAPSSVDSVSPTSPVLEAALAQVFTGLTRAGSELELLTACGPLFRALAPSGVELLDDGGGRLARWAPEGRAPLDAGPALDAQELRWRQGPVYVADVATDPRCDAARGALQAAGVAATAIVPLRCDVLDVVGAVRLDFAEPRQFGADERDALVVIANGLATFLVARRHLLRQREALRALERERTTLHTILDHLPVGVFLAEAGTGKVLLVNHRGVEMLGRGVDPNARTDNYQEVYQCMRVGSDEVMPAEDLPLVQTLTSGEPSQGAMDILRPGGDRISIEVSAAPLRDGDGAMFAAVVAFSDVTERNRVEAERTAYRDELIRAQAQALAERSTPLVPLGDGVVAMPIVGTLDRERADQIVEVLLAGCAARKARVAILDVTGVPHADTAVAGALLRAAAAVRLLGVEPILTGIRPDVARALVALHVDLKGLVTLSTLQDGIFHATGQRRH